MGGAVNQGDPPAKELNASTAEQRPNPHLPLMTPINGTLGHFFVSLHT